jgi:hypothetical protein
MFDLNISVDYREDIRVEDDILTSDNETGGDDDE